MNQQQLALDTQSESGVGRKMAKRKKVRKEENWAENQRKLKRARGESYCNKKGRIIAERTTGPPCNCKQKCFEKVTLMEQQNILQDFNNIGNKEQQDSYLFGLIEKKDIKRQRPRLPVCERSKTKAASFAYKVFVDGLMMNVCQRAFRAFHGITQSRLERLRSHRISNRTAPKDMRGKHNNRGNAKSLTVISDIDCFIQSVNTRDWIGNVIGLYRLYKEYVALKYAESTVVASEVLQSNANLSAVSASEPSTSDVVSQKTESGDKKYEIVKNFSTCSKNCRRVTQRS